MSVTTHRFWKRTFSLHPSHLSFSRSLPAVKTVYSKRRISKRGKRSRIGFEGGEWQREVTEARDREVED
jgi:hypothetical protein